MAKNSGMRLQIEDAFEIEDRSRIARSSGGSVLDSGSCEFFKGSFW